MVLAALYIPTTYRLTSRHLIRSRLLGLVVQRYPVDRMVRWKIRCHSIPSYLPFVGIRHGNETFTVYFASGSELVISDHSVRRRKDYVRLNKTLRKYIRRNKARR